MKDSTKKLLKQREILDNLFEDVLDLVDKAEQDIKKVSIKDDDENETIYKA